MFMRILVPSFMSLKFIFWLLVSGQCSPLFSEKSCVEIVSLDYRIEQWMYVRLCVHFGKIYKLQITFIYKTCHIHGFFFWKGVASVQLIVCPQLLTNGPFW